MVQGAALLAFLLHGVKSDATPEGGWIRVEPPADAPVLADPALLGN